MERLTDRNADGNAFYKACFAAVAPCGGGMPGEACAECGAQQKQCDKLAAYEDTGLSAEDVPSGLELAEVHSAIRLLKQYEAIGDIDDLTALVKARDEGRVVELPCKTGVTAWNIKSMFSFCSEPKEEVIDRLVVSDGGVDVAFRSGYKFAVERIGKSIFLTRAEAEAALEGAVEHE